MVLMGRAKNTRTQNSEIRNNRKKDIATNKTLKSWLTRNQMLTYPCHILLLSFQNSEF